MFINIGEFYINTKDILYVNTNGDLKPLTTRNMVRQVTPEKWDTVKAVLDQDSSFFYLENYGYINVDNIISWDYSEANSSYYLRYLNNNNNIVLTKDNIKDLDDSLKNFLENYEPNSGGGGSSSDFQYTNSTPMPKDLGGFSKGTTFVNKTSKEMWDGLLYPYIAPSVITLSTTKTQLEIGDTLTSPLSVTWDTSEQDKITNTAIYFDNILLEENLNVSGTKSFAITPVQLTAQGSKTIKCEITDEKSSKYSKTTNINWVNLYYLGNSTKDTLTEDDIKTFNKFNGNGISSEFTITGSGYKYICYPKAWGIFKYMDKDSKFDISMKDPEVINLTNDFGVIQEFYIHRTNQSIGGSLTFVKQ